MSKQVSTDKGFMRSLSAIILPITLQFFMFSLIPVSDAVMLVTLDQDSMSAVSLGAQMMFIMNLFTGALSGGASIFAAQYWGKGDTKEIGKVFGYSVFLTMPVLIALFVCAFFFPTGSMRIFTDDPSIIAHGVNYLQIVAVAYILDGLAQMYAVVLKNTEHIRESMVISIIMVVMNIVLNAVFIYGLLGIPQLAERGAAIATVISCTLGFVASVVVMHKKTPVRLTRRTLFKTPMDFRRDFSKYCGPSLANSLFWGFGFMMITVIMGHLGSDAAAANSIVAVVKDLVSCFCFALGTGSVILIGNLLGAGELDRAKEWGSKFCRLAIVSGIIAGILIAAAAPIIVDVANLTPTASHYLKIMLYLCVYYMVGRSINSTVISGIFTAGGDTKFGFICDTITMWAFIVPVGLFVAFVLELPVLWVFFILNLDELVKLPAVYLHYKKYKWVRNLVNKESESPA